MLKNFYALSSAFLTCICFSMTYAQSAATYNPDKDGQVSFANSGTNYGTSNTANVSVVSSSDYYRMLLGFNLSGIPSTAVIVSASLELKPTASGEGGAGASSFVVQGITGSWAEGTVNFGNQPATTSSNQQTASTWNTGSSGRREFDIKLMVQAHVSGSIPLTGFMVRRNSETTTATPCQYHTKEATSSTDRPYLKISWYDAIKITGATITKTSGVGTTDGGVSLTVTGGNSSAGSGSLTYQWYNTSGTISGATSASISSKGAGCYGVVITAPYGPTYNMMFLVGTRCEIVTMDLIKDPLFVDDAEVYSFTPTTNSGAAVTMNAGRSIGVSRNYYFYLINRLWPDASNSFFSATQYLYGSAHTTGGYNLANCYRTTANWSESTITWNNKPVMNLTTPTPVLLSAPLTSTENKVLDLTTFFEYANANPTTSFGYGFIGSDASAAATSYQQYHTSEATTASNRPYVSVKLDDASCDRFPYYGFKKNIDASYVFTEKGKLRAQFFEEYQQTGKWAMKLYDNNRVLKAAVAMDGTAVPGSPALLPWVSYVYGDNRATLDLTTYGLTNGAFYILELTRSTGEKEFIEFIYKN